MSTCKKCQGKKRSKKGSVAGIGGMDYSQEGLFKAAQYVGGGLAGRIVGNILEKQAKNPMLNLAGVAVGVLTATSDNPLLVGAGVGLAITGGMNAAKGYAKSGNAGAAEVQGFLGAIGEMNDFELMGLDNDAVAGYLDYIYGLPGENEIAGDEEED